MVMYFGFCICPERQRSIIQCFWQGSYEITAWEIHFWGYVYVCVSVYEREREANYSGTRGREAVGFIRLPKAPYVENTLRPTYISGILIIHPAYPKCLTAPRVPRSVLSFPQIPTTSFSPDKPAQLHRLPHL